MSTSVPLLATQFNVLGPWSIEQGRKFASTFMPNQLERQPEDTALKFSFLDEADWATVDATVVQDGQQAVVTVAGHGNLDHAADQVRRLLALDIDARAWTEVGTRDAVMADMQRRFHGLRPCGFHSAYEAAIWAVLSQRIHTRDARRYQDELIANWGTNGMLPTPKQLAAAQIELPFRKGDYLQAVAEAAEAGHLDGVMLRELPTAAALRRIQEVKGLGPFAAELVLIRGAGAPDVFPSNERQVRAEVEARYGFRQPIEAATASWSPFRSWAVFYLRVDRAGRSSANDPIVR